MLNLFYFGMQNKQFECIALTFIKFVKCPLVFTLVLGCLSKFSGGIDENSPYNVISDPLNPLHFTSFNVGPSVKKIERLDNNNN